MTWLAPWALAGAAAAAIGVALLHLLARDRPPRYTLPTTRFVAAGAARATRRARTPRDLLLLALRVLAIVLAGAAFAGPLLTPERRSVATVVLLDASTRGVTRVTATDSARARLGATGRLVLFDSAAYAVPQGAERTVLDSLARVAGDSIGSAPVRGSLSAGLVAALRTAADAAQQADSVALAIVSPLLGVEDAATVRIRELWPGRIEVVAGAAAPASGVGSGESDAAPASAAIVVRGPAMDPVVAAARLIGAVRGAGSSAAGTRIVRDVPTAADSAFARGGGTLLVWPAGVSAPSASGDTVGGFVVEGIPVLFATNRDAAPPAGEVMARWVDGVPAVTQAAHGRGCIRTAAIDVPEAGDATLGPAFQRALRTLAAPCGTAVPAPASESLRAALARELPLASAVAIRGDATRSPLTPWLLAAAIALLLVELLVRRAPREAPTQEQGA